MPFYTIATVVKKDWLNEKKQPFSLNTLLYNYIYLLFNEPFYKSEVISLVFCGRLFIVHLCSNSTRFKLNRQQCWRRHECSHRQIQNFLLPLTERREICSHEISSLWHDGLQTDTGQTRGQLVPLVTQRCRKLLKVALRRTKRLMFSLKALSNCFLVKAGNKKEKYKGHGLMVPLDTLVFFLQVLVINAAWLPKFFVSLFHTSQWNNIFDVSSITLKVNWWRLPEQL